MLFDIIGKGHCVQVLAHNVSAPHVELVNSSDRLGLFQGFRQISSAKLGKSRPLANHCPPAK